MIMRNSEIGSRSLYWYESIEFRVCVCVCPLGRRDKLNAPEQIERTVAVTLWRCESEITEIRFANWRYGGRGGKLCPQVYA